MFANEAAPMCHRGPHAPWPEGYGLRGSASIAAECGGRGVRMAGHVGHTTLNGTAPRQKIG